MLERLVLKNTSKCTSQRLKWTSGARVGRGMDADWTPDWTRIGRGLHVDCGLHTDCTRMVRRWDADWTRIVKKGNYLLAKEGPVEFAPNK